MKGNVDLFLNWDLCGQDHGCPLRQKQKEFLVKLEREHTPKKHPGRSKGRNTGSTQGAQDYHGHKETESITHRYSS